LQLILQLTQLRDLTLGDDIGRDALEHFPGLSSVAYSTEIPYPGNVLMLPFVTVVSESDSA
jgi:hypothetical protein